MKKIMFNDCFGLTDAVLQGRKTMTRRIARFDESDYSPFKVGEVVAVAQSGKEIYNQLQQRYGNTSDAALGFMEMYKGLAMWRNKMFVPADLCPNKIRITGIKVERLQDISDEDCLKEGVTYDSTYWIMGYKVENLWNKTDRQSFFRSARSAFAALIDKISGKGTWERNPYVFAYTFELL